MEFFNQTYIALRGPTGAPQTAGDTIGKLADRLSPATLLADRRAAVLALKGLARAHRVDVGERALPGLLGVLAHDAALDADIGRAALETIGALCDPAEDGALAQVHADQLLAAEGIPDTLFSLLADQAFYVRFATLQLFVSLLQMRRQVVQAHFLKAPEGARGVIAVLEDKREIIRNEAMLMVQSLTSQSADIQKVLAFEGAFEKLFNTISQEQGVDGGVVVRDALICVDGLLRFNSSNQSYFRETPYPPLLCSLLLFPPNLPLHEIAPQTFALQFWDEPKTENVSLVVGIIGMLVNSKGGSPQETGAFTRCLIELALASNAPTPIKSKALGLVPANSDVPLSAVVLTTYVPVPETNGEEWDRLEPASALDAVVELVLHGEYNGQSAASRTRDSLDLRAVALSVFENFVRPDDMKIAIVRAMLPPPDAPTPPATPLLAALAAPPSSPDIAFVASTQLAALLFAHLLRGAPDAKTLARALIPPTSLPDAGGSSGAFFVPADAPGTPGTPASARSAAPAPDDDEDEPQTLLQTLSEHLSLAFLARRRADTSDADAREWDRLVVGYLCLLVQWLWEDPVSVREFLEAGALGMLVEPINQTSEQDVVVPGLCAFLLGVCYEFNREPGEVTRGTIYPILNRLGVDSLVGRMTRFREDDRFKAISPEAIVLPYAPPTGHAAAPGVQTKDNTAEVWFDWAFVDFWKSNYYVIQKGIAVGPDALASSGGQNVESAMLIASLREVIKTQAQEIDALHRQLRQASATPAPAPAPAPALAASADEVNALRAQLSAMALQVKEAEAKSKETEKEQEDLLVLLDELNSKRRRDKQRMHESGLDVSEDEDGDDDDDDE